VAVARGTDFKLALAGVAVATLAGGAGASLLFAQTPGPSVNMVSGTSLPGGDPFLQRQNEPSIAVSTRNPEHLLAGANDYRTVDLPGLPDDEETGDSWVGLFSSLDGGQTWRSTLVPGYPQDTSPEGLASPLKGLAAAADPVVRAGTHGLFYYGLMAFDRDKKVSRLAVARFVDMNDREGGDIAAGTSPIRYAGTSVVAQGNSGQFVDKPWLVVDVPRPGAATCVLPTSPPQSVPAGIVYMAWARLTGVRNTQLMLARSLDCGASWSQPVSLSEGEARNQAPALAIDPVSGELYVAWRRFAVPQADDAIVLVQSSDLGESFSKPRELVPAGGTPLAPFDQGSDPALGASRTAFRTNAYPSLAVSVDATGRRRVHVAWAQRTRPAGDARIVLSTSEDGGATWSEPSPVDAGPLEDDFGGAFDRGHQFMPQLASRSGRLLVLYYDTRLDHTRGVRTPGRDPVDPSATGPLYLEQRVPQGELVLPGGSAGADLVFTPHVDDAQPPLLTHRHTIDVRVAQLDLREGVDFARPRFTSARVSHYPYGITGTRAGGEALDVPDALHQLKFNPPNLPLFAMGTTPFVGDYIDVGGLEFVPGPGGEWRFATEWAAAPVFHAVWTSNEDVRPPPDGDWTSYTPPGRPGCVPGREGMRNQNVYTGRITQGLAVSSPQTTIPLPPFQAEDASSIGAFVVDVQNSTGEARSLRLRILDQPVDGVASFVPPEVGTPPRTTLDVQVAGHSGTSRTVFAASSDPAAPVRVEVAEVDAPGGDLVPHGLTAFVTLNGDPSTPVLQSRVASLSLGLAEGETSLDDSSSSISNPSISNPSISNPSISNPSISNPSISNPSISNPSISNPSISNPSISNPSISNLAIGDSSLGNPSISNQTLAASPVSDATYSVTNTGSSSTAYHVKLVGDPAAAPGPLRLRVTKQQRSPASEGCDLIENVQAVVLVDVAQATVEPVASSEAAASEPSPEDATFSLRPGETARVSLQAPADQGRMAEVTAAVAPVVTPLFARASEAAPLVVPAPDGLPRGRYGVPYSADLEAFGGRKPYKWRGSLPGGLAVGQQAPGYAVSGAPLEVGEHVVTLEVEDEEATTTVRRFVLGVDRARPTLEVSAPRSVRVGEPVTFAVSLRPEGQGAPSGKVTVTAGDGEGCALSAPEGRCELTFAGVGSRTIAAAYAGDRNFETAASMPLTLTVEPAVTSISLEAADEAVAGEALEVRATVYRQPPSAGAPAGAVQFYEGPHPLGGPVPLSGGAASLSLSDIKPGNRTIRAVYAGDGSHLASEAQVSVKVSPAKRPKASADSGEAQEAGKAGPAGSASAPGKLKVDPRY
jgi:hypothetical protein